MYSLQHYPGVDVRQMKNICSINRARLGYNSIKYFKFTDAFMHISSRFESRLIRNLEYK
jgi:hypothetical protein